MVVTSDCNGPGNQEVPDEDIPLSSLEVSFIERYYLDHDEISFDKILDFYYVLLA